MSNEEIKQLLYYAEVGFKQCSGAAYDRDKHILEELIDELKYTLNYEEE